jgi:hypothetical protein
VPTSVWTRQSGPDQQTQQAANLQWPPPSCRTAKKHNAAFHLALFVVFHINAHNTSVANWLLYAQLLRCSWRGSVFCTWNYWIWKACVPDNFSTVWTHTMRPTSTPLSNSSSVLRGFLGLRDEMRQIFTHPSVPTLHRWLEWNGRKFWQTVENIKTTGNSTQHIF